MWKDKGVIEAKFHSYSRVPEKKRKILTQLPASFHIQRLGIFKS